MKNTLLLLALLISSGLCLPVVASGSQDNKPAQASISVKAYGATGNGSTDDTKAIQRAIAAAAGRTLHFPKPAAYYKVTSSIALTSNLTITGDQAVIQMSSRASSSGTASIFYNAQAISNVDVSGLVLKSTNNQRGAGYTSKSLTSNVQGFYFQNAHYVRLHDMKMYNLVNGIKFSSADSSGIYIDRVSIYSSPTPIYMSRVNEVHINDVLLDGSGFNDPHLHCIYFEAGVSNVFINKARLQNIPTGGGVHLYQQDGGVGGDNIRITNVSAYNLGTAFYVWAGAHNIVIDGFSAEQVSRIFSLDQVTNVTITNGTIKAKKTIGSFDSSVSNVEISNLTIDGSKQSGSAYLFDLQKGTNVTFKNVTTNNVRDGVAPYLGLKPTNMDVKNTAFRYAHYATAQ